ncbi:MAG: hypothetical protein SCALA702_01100 [Melioribacteraceae bacterium]|nr:MAG: hypothetical protein SCALA702_01100 [Melioribacteraceae bacterium]
MCEEGLWEKAAKYSTRDYRGVEDDVVKIDDESINYDESTEKKSKIRLARMRALVEICGSGNGKVYYKNGNIYGVSITEIIQSLSKSHLAVIISDFKVISELKKDERLEGKIKVMYLASTIDERELLKRYKEREKTQFPDANRTLKTIKSIQNMSSILLSAGRLKYLTKIEETLPLLNEEWNHYVPYFDTIKTRATNIRMLYNRYIDNIALIDYVILNFYDLDYMFNQTKNILTNISPKRKINIPPIFMVCAANSSGKATLMEVVGDMGDVHENIVVTNKYAKRDSRPTDGRDGMIAIGKNGDFKKAMETELNFKVEDKDIWEWGFKQRPTKYAVCHKEIKNNIIAKKAQIFISNMDEIKNARKFYEKNIVVLYLHATHESSTKKHIYAKRRFELEKEIRQKHRDITKEQVKFEFENNQDLQERFQTITSNDEKEIVDVHYDFCKHNIQIDHVLLNTGTREDLIEQITNLIIYYSAQ